MAEVYYPSTQERYAGLTPHSLPPTLPSSHRTLPPSFFFLKYVLAWYGPRPVKFLEFYDEFDFLKNFLKKSAEYFYIILTDYECPR